MLTCCTDPTIIRHTEYLKIVLHIHIDYGFELWFKPSSAHAKKHNSLFKMLNKPPVMVRCSARSMLNQKPTGIMCWMSGRPGMCKSSTSSTNGSSHVRNDIVPHLAYPTRSLLRIKVLCNFSRFDVVITNFWWIWILRHTYWPAVDGISNHRKWSVHQTDHRLLLCQAEVKSSNLENLNQLTNRPQRLFCCSQTRSIPFDSPGWFRPFITRFIPFLVSSN